MSCKKNCDHSYVGMDLNFGSLDRFDLEVAIINNMNIIDDLNVIIEDVLEGEGVSLDADQLVNTLQGIINLHTMQYNKLWSTFTSVFQLDKPKNYPYNTDTE